LRRVSFLLDLSVVSGLDGSHSVDVSSGRVSNSLESLEGVSSGGVGHEDLGVDGSSGTGDGSVDGGRVVSLGASSDLADGLLVDTVVGTVSDSNVDFLAVLATGNTDGGGSLGSVVETGHVQGVSGEHVFVELDEVGVVTLGELPDEILRNGHIPHD